MIKRSLKRFVSAGLALLSAVVLSACGRTYVSDPQDEAQMEYVASYLMNTMVVTSDEEVAKLLEQLAYEQDVVVYNGYNSWQSSKEDLGALVSVNDVKVEKKAGYEYKATVNATFEKRDCEFLFSAKIMQHELKEITEITFNPVYSLGEKMNQAGVNLLVGMGTVFAVLIFLTWIISLFKYVNKLPGLVQGKKKAETETKSETRKADAVLPMSEEDEINAVIAAAVAAYEADEKRAGGKSGKAFAGGPALTNGIRVQGYRRNTRS